MKNAFHFFRVKNLKVCLIALAAITGLTMADCSSTSKDSSGTPDDSSDVPSFVFSGDVMPFRDISATELVSEIRVGWNLGNTFDAIGSDRLGADYVKSLAQLETMWVRQITTEANFIALKEAGFNVIRIPVSWTKVANNDYIIREDWMNRVKEVVDYAINNDMYVILNTHHDEGVFKINAAGIAETRKSFAKTWEQIAAAFGGYSEKLIFEGLNEPRTKGSSREWQGGTSAEWANLNELQQIFVDTVRKSGGNNDKRILMITGYAASAERSALTAIELPNDPGTTSPKLVVSIHAYTPYDFALNTNKAFNSWSKSRPNDTRPIIEILDRADELFLSKGIPVIMGEFGAMNKDNAEARAEWAEFYTSYARSKGIPCVWWDNGATSGGGELFGLLDRRTNVFVFPEVKDALVKGANTGS